LVQSTRARIQSLVTGAPRPSKPLTYYYEVNPTLFTITSHTFVGGLFGLLGMQNIADRLDNGTGRPQLSPQALLAANPDFIFLVDTDCCGQSAATVAARPGYSALSVVQKQRVVALDPDVASRWGPRVTDLMTNIVNALQPAPAGG
jgi:iron complex transport system substrate-binding protein